MPEWTEGVCGDGAAILCDGVMVPIDQVLAALNSYEQLKQALHRIAKQSDDYDFMSRLGIINEIARGALKR